MNDLPILPNEGKCPCCHEGTLGLDDYGRRAPTGMSEISAQWVAETAIYVCSQCKSGITYVRQFHDQWELLRASRLGSEKGSDGQQTEDRQGITFGEIVAQAFLGW